MNTGENCEMSSIRDGNALIVLLLIAGALLAIKFSMQGPLYPHEASKKGLRASQYTFTISVYEIAILFMNLSLIPAIGKFGANQCFIAGNILTGLSCIAFGVLHYIDNGAIFMAMSFAIKIKEGTGTSGAYVTSGVLISYHYSENKGFFISVKEVCVSVGMCLGPVIGGELMDATNFSVPFISSGLLLVFCALAAKCILKKSETEERRQQSIRVFTVIKLPGMWVGLLSSLLTCCSFGFVNMILEPYIRVFNYSGFEVGLFFAIFSVVFALFSPVFGVIMDKGFSPLIQIAFGTLCRVLCFIFLGPIPYDNPQVWSIILALVFNGIGVAGMNVSGLMNTLNILKINSYGDSESITVIGTAFWSSAIAIGYIIGAPLGGIMFDFVGMKAAGIVLAIVNACFLLAVIGAYSKGRFIKEHSFEETSETDKLLS